MQTALANFCRCLLLPLVSAIAALPAAPASDAIKPIRIGFSMSLTGGVAVNGKQFVASA
jgi:hypothetical protein